MLTAPRPSPPLTLARAASPAAVDPLLAALSPRQREAVTHAGGPLLLSCGPGSGKTRILTVRLAWLLRRGVPPSQCLALTFSRLAADELSDRLAALLGPAARGVWTGTFHAFGAWWLRSHAGLLGRTPRFTIFDREDTRRALGRLARELGLDESPAALAGAVEAAKTAETPADALPAGLARLLTAYEALLARHDALDFTDLLVRPVALFARHRALRDQLRARFHHVACDEGQDLCALQHRLLELLAGPGSLSSAPPAGLTVAADEDQGCYQFRGAQPTRLLAFERAYPGATVLSVGENYRSTPELLAAAARLIAHNRARRPKPLMAVGAAGPPPLVLEWADDEAEAQGLAARLAEWAQAEPEPVAVLARLTALLSPIARACEHQGLTVRVQAETPLTERKEIRDLLAYLRVLVNPRDWAAWERCLPVPPRGLGPKRLAVLRAGVVHQGAEPVLAAAARTHRGLAQLLGLLDALRRDAAGPIATLETLAERIGYRAYLRRQAEPDDTERRWGHVEELLALARAWEARHGTDLPAFLDHLCLTDAQEAPADGVQIESLTLHAAKGLEFSTVVLVGLEEGLLPHHRHLEGEALEEERRLCYIGMTRARRRLVLSVCRSRRLWGRSWTLLPSRFLDEAGLSMAQHGWGG